MAQKQVDLVYLGNVSTKINTDFSDWNTENSAALLGTYGSIENPLWEQGLTESDDAVTDVDDDGSMRAQNPGSAPTDQINGVEINGVTAYNYVITYADGTTHSSDSNFVQLENGDIYLVQSDGGTADDDVQNPTTPWEAKSIISVELVSVANPDSEGEYTAGGILYDNITGADLVVCFASGTLIDTATGLRPVEDLTVGDLVLTLDEGYEPIRWIGSRQLDSIDLTMHPNLRPIRIKAGALGEGLPVRDLVVSPQHRILSRSKIARNMFDSSEVLAPAKQFVLCEGIDVADDLDEVTYWHFMFDKHQVVYSEGAATESLYTGPEAIKAIGPEAVKEIQAIMPELLDEHQVPIAARPLLSGRQARKLAARHVNKHRAIVENI